MQIRGPTSRVHLGNHVMMYAGEPHLVFVTNSGEVWVGDDCVLGYGARFLCGYHDIEKRNEDRHPFPSEGFDIRIGRGVFVGSFAIIIGPCSIGDNAVIGAGSVVAKDVPPGQVWVGNPAGCVREIEFKE